jgi:hypothetical protein
MKMGEFTVLHHMSLTQILKFDCLCYSLSIDWRPSSTQYFTKVNKTRKRRHDIVYRIASPLNLNFPFTKTDLPTMFMFYTAETKTLLPSQFTGGTFADFVDRCRSGHIVPITPSQWYSTCIQCISNCYQFM